MTAQLVEMRQLEQLVQDRVKELLSSKDIESVIVEAVTAAVSEAVIRELKETVSFNLEETNQLGEDLRKLEESLREAKREHFLAQDELEQYQQISNLRVFGIPESDKQHTDALVLDVVHYKLQLTHVNISVGAKNEGKPRPIIDLTMERLALLNAAIAKHGLHNKWTADGRIVVKSGARRFRISTSEELKTEMLSSPGTRHFQLCPSSIAGPQTHLSNALSPYHNCLQVAHNNSLSLLWQIDDERRCFMPLSMHAILISES
ncbi:hypothetical protein PR048_013967 [Dryococelus australis]|uniref:Uncharacterized protein n=1 Tax=Dryococelus australis TaxID=614101 RepID=A0ABQ9HTP9_9NEOP|nr:hypothetical protein PR048_013967 [Dryococelus australis]